jgi:hypothetical protein
MLAVGSHQTSTQSGCLSCNDHINQVKWGEALIFIAQLSDHPLVDRVGTFVETYLFKSSEEEAA